MPTITFDLAKKAPRSLRRKVARLEKIFQSPHMRKEGWVVLGRDADVEPGILAVFTDYKSAALRDRVHKAWKEWKSTIFCFFHKQQASPHRDNMKLQVEYSFMFDEHELVRDVTKRLTQVDEWENDPARSRRGVWRKRKPPKIVRPKRRKKRAGPKRIARETIGEGLAEHRARGNGVHA
jgi:hypothetical protein